MGLRIKKKTLTKTAVVTILGLQGVKALENFEHQAYYSFEGEDGGCNYLNTLPLFMKKYHKKHTIIPISTVEAQKFNQEVLKKTDATLLEHIEFNPEYVIKDEKDIDEIFKLYNTIFDRFDEVIVDVTHGFRHLPLLMIVELIMQNFKSIDKIKHIYFAKEIKKHTPFEKGEYEIIDLKEYVDIANISFILTTFQNNFTVANHIKSKKYEKLIDSLNNFSNDMMALSLNNLYNKSSKELIAELKKVDALSISKQADSLAEFIEKITTHDGKKRYITYFDLAKELANKNYMLIGLSLLYESVRLYIKTTMKKEQPVIVQKIENYFKDDLYKIGDFFIKFKKDGLVYEKFIRNYKQLPLSRVEFAQLQYAFPKEMLEPKPFLVSNHKSQNIIEAIAYTRNNLAHANVNGNFNDIKKGILDLLNRYERVYIKES